MREDIKATNALKPRVPLGGRARKAEGGGTPLDMRRRPGSLPHRALLRDQGIDPVPKQVVSTSRVWEAKYVASISRLANPCPARFVELLKGQVKNAAVRKP